MKDLTPILRTSERSSFATCIQQWWWAWRQGLRPRGMAKTPLWFGTNFHVSLAEWYCGPGDKRGPHPAETWERLSKDILDTVRTRSLHDDEEAVYVDALHLGLVLAEEYVKFHGRDEHMLVIQPEQTFQMDIPWPKLPGRQAIYEVDSETNELLVRYAGTYDLVWRHADTGQLALEEHKTAARVTTGHLPLDRQAGSYWAVASHTLRKQGLIGESETLAYIEYNFIRKSLPDERPTDAQGYALNLPLKADYYAALGIEKGTPEFKLKKEELQALAEERGVEVLGARSTAQPTPLFERHKVYRTVKEQASQLRAIQDEAIHMRAVKDGLLPVTKATSRSCERMCDFYEMCLLHENGGNWKDYRDAMFKREDPYADHRKHSED